MDMALCCRLVATVVDSGVPGPSTELICQLRCDVATGPCITNPKLIDLYHMREIDL